MNWTSLVSIYNWFEFFKINFVNFVKQFVSMCFIKKFKQKKEHSNEIAFVEHSISQISQMNLYVCVYYLKHLFGYSLGYIKNLECLIYLFKMFLMHRFYALTI